MLEHWILNLRRKGECQSSEEGTHADCAWRILGLVLQDRVNGALKTGKVRRVWRFGSDGRAGTKHAQDPGFDLRKRSSP